MSRADELHKIFEGIEEREIVTPLIDEAVFLEIKMQELKKYPHIKIHPTNPDLQKVTAAGKQYREYLQTYTNIIDKLCRIYSRADVKEGASALTEFAIMAKELMNNKAKK